MPDHFTRMTMAATTLSRYTLDSGKHETFAAGHCAMELVAYLAGEPHSDSPQCTCPQLARFFREWNDLTSDYYRNKLVLPFVPRLIGARSTTRLRERRDILLHDWGQRFARPMYMDLVESQRPVAAALRAMPEATTRQQIEERKPIVAAAMIAVREAGKEDDWFTRVAIWKATPAMVERMLALK